MKLILSLIAILFGTSLYLFTKAKRENINKIVPRSDSVNFKTQVLPILKKNCSPCHFPGGKMYTKMPFDSARTLLSHEAGIIRRIRDEKEKSVINEYLNQNKVGQ